MSNTETLEECGKRLEELRQRRPELVGDRDTKAIADYFEAKGRKEGFERGVWTGFLWTFGVVLWLFIGNSMGSNREVYGSVVIWWQLLPFILGFGYWVVRIIWIWKTGGFRRE